MMPLQLSETKDLRIQPVGLAGISVGRFTEATGVSVNYLELDDVHVVGTNASPAWVYP